MPSPVAPLQGFKEEEEQKQSGQPVNPYDAMSRIMDISPKPKQDKREDDR